MSTPPNPGSGAQPQATSAAIPQTTVFRSITDFLTDGSLAALCAELARLTGVEVELRDATNHRIVRTFAADGTPTWDRLVVEPAETGNAIPLTLAEIDGRPIGAIVIGKGEPRLSDDARVRLESALRLLAGTASELCQHEVELRNRSKELAALSRMSSLLVRAAGPERVLEVALESAIEVL
ncbi:MAG: hypothetical protein NTV94_17370, partial [Planctomycetota bacterium]|nr:hypothetical protein [Planctomycetota bacterium]